MSSQVKINSEITSTEDFPTIESCIGNTPLVRLQRLPGETTNVLLGKLEGDNPAGSVKDRPAISMIARAEKRGEGVAALIRHEHAHTGFALLRDPG